MEVTKTAVFDYLVKNAREKNILYYSELFNYFGIRTGPANDANAIPLLLGQIIRDNHQQGLPLLPSIVVQKDKDRPRDQLIPGDKYFESLAEIRGIPIPASKAEKRRLHAIERDAVFAFYQ